MIRGLVLLVMLLAFLGVLIWELTKKPCTPVWFVNNELQMWEGCFEDLKK